jgi:tagatose-1,6-bisphosphate aldolase non-catalytic subunit AgaZ/GatZ
MNCEISSGMRPNFLTKDSLYALSEEEKKFIKESREIFLKGNVWELLQYRPKIFKYLSEIVLEKRIDFLKQLFAYSSTWTFYTLQWVCEAMVEAFKTLKETVKNDPILHTQVVGILYEMKETTKETVDNCIKNLTLEQAKILLQQPITDYVKIELNLKIDSEE